MMYKSLMTVAILFCFAGCKNPDLPQNVYQGSNRQAILDNILTRRAVRKYTPQQISKLQIDTLMKSAIYAPSALNKQPWEIRVVQNPDILNQINQRFLNFAKGKTFQGSAAHYKEPGFSIFHHAPTLIVIASPKEDKLAPMDDGIALENILLTAHAMGLGTCPLGTLVTTLNQPENRDLLKLLNIPDDCNVMINVAVGYPAENPPAPVRFSDKVKVIE